MGWLQRFPKWLVDFYHSLLNFYYKFVIAYGMGLACLVATVALKDIAPIWPLGYYTLVWVLAFFFPVSADSRVDHQLLGFLSERYRRAFFLPA